VGQWVVLGDHRWQWYSAESQLCKIANDEALGRGTGV
jgi:hypothetical protein